MGLGVVAGTFDGVHIAHRKLVRIAVNSSSPTCALVIQNSAESLTTPDEKQRLLKGLGVHQVIAKPLDNLKNMTAADFFEKCIVQELKASLVVVGFNFTFGKGKEGNVAFLAELCDEYGVELKVMPPLKVGGALVSSTRIRKLLAAGNTRTASSLLGRQINGRKDLIGMWTSIYMAQTLEMAEKVRNALEKSAVLARVYDSGNEMHEVLVPSTEMEKAHETILMSC
ncbi:MAG: FAD synthetase family protein [Clostridiales bacterium]|jgi:FAD synthase|nr:FAD synthetase family protein [Clostridiales bacterium]